MDWYFNKCQISGEIMENLMSGISENMLYTSPNNVPCFKVGIHGIHFMEKFMSYRIFYGGNTSGKTTLLNLIADKLHLSRTALFNKSPLGG